MKRERERETRGTYVENNRVSYTAGNASHLNVCNAVIDSNERAGEEEGERASCDGARAQGAAHAL
jgi:hypothetical protein